MSKKRPEDPKGDRSRSTGGSGTGSGKAGDSRKPPGTGSAADREAARAGTHVDVGEIARAVSTSFLILVFGALVQPIAGTILPESIGQFWLIAVAVIAFGIAGYRCGTAGPNPPLYGAGASVASFLLVIPLQFIQATFDPLYALYTLIAAAVVGGIAGQVSARTRT